MDWLILIHTNFNRVVKPEAIEVEKRRSVWLLRSPRPESVPSFRLILRETQWLWANRSEAGEIAACEWYHCGMIQKSIQKRALTDSSTGDDLSFWKSRSPAERIAAVEILRRQRYGSAARLQRSVRVIKRTQR
jgi:hypothetical protein